MTVRRVTLGIVAGVYGVRGWLRVVPQTQTAKKILSYSGWCLHLGEQRFETQVVTGREHGSGVVVHLTGPDGQPMADRDVAAQWLGALIEVDRSALPVLPKGQFYWTDLVGLRVVNLAGQTLGLLQEMTSNGMQDVMVVVDDQGVQRLIPFVEPDIVERVDLELERIVCAWELDY